MSSKVIVVPSTLISNGETVPIGDGAFAKVDIKEGEIVENGVARQIPIDGNSWEMVFTWSEDRSKWATCTGAASYYNTSLHPNTKMTREFQMFDNGKLATYEIRATRDIKAGEALTHTYRSLQWRTKFEEIKDSVDDVTFPSLDVPLPESKVQCDKIVVNNYQAYAGQDFNDDDIIELGVFRIRPGKVDGDFSNDLSLWRVPAIEKDQGEEKWALVSGKAMMLSGKRDGEAVNTKFEFDRETRSFVLRAVGSIKQGDELTVTRATHNRPAAYGF